MKKQVEEFDFLQHLWPQPRRTIQIGFFEDSSTYPFFLYRRAVFNPLLIVSLSILVCLWKGTDSRGFLCTGLTGLLFLGIQFYRLKELAAGLYVEKQTPKQGTEKESGEISVTIKNLSRWSFDGCLIHCDLPFSSEKNYRLWVQETIQALQIKKYLVPFKFDSGMGVFKSGGLTIWIRDPLGFFERKIRFDYEGEVSVLPLAEKVRGSSTLKSQRQFSAGSFDIEFKGASTILRGLREYRSGDPLKHIAWKISAKKNELFVKEFEEIQQKRITILFDLVEEDQGGRASLSSWEATKDTVLALVDDYQNRGYLVQLMSPQFFLPFGRGKDFLKSCVAEVLKEVVSEKEFGASGGAFLQKIPRDEPFIYVTSILDKGENRIFRLVKELSKKTSRGSIYLVDTADLIQKVLATVHEDVAQGQIVTSQIQRCIQRLKALGIHVIKIDSMSFKSNLQNTKAEKINLQRKLKHVS